MRAGGVVRDAAVLSAIGIGPDERRRVLGVSVALSDADRPFAPIAVDAPDEFHVELDLVG